MIYKECIKSKDGLDVPLFLNGKPMHSKYRPEAEAQAFANSVLTENNDSFFIVAGIGGGYHIQALRNKFPDSFILALEADRESLDFCLKIPENKSLLENPKNVFIPAENFHEQLSSLYLPHLCTNIALLVNRSWSNENAGLLKNIESIFKKNVDAIAADYSVQSYFAKQWQRNILLNLKTFSNNPCLSFPEKKIAAIIAAGPSLDKSIDVLRKNRESYFIISTDTGLGILAENGIKPDAVVCIDAQRVSLTHFFAVSLFNDISNMIFVFDILANADGPSFIKKMGGNVFFASSSHPLASIAGKDKSFNFVPVLQSGGGTVTVAACDLARLWGFKSIQVFGADFAYSCGKAYARGSYLDTNFSCQSGRLNTLEYCFTSLMFRTPVKKAENPSKFSGKLNNPFTSSVLETYKRGLEAWAEQYGYKLKNNILTCDRSYKMDFSNVYQYKFDFKKFINCLDENLRKDLENKDKTLTEYEYSLLPYIAYLRKKEKAQPKDSVFDLLKLAYSQIRRYNTSL